MAYEIESKNYWGLNIVIVVLIGILLAVLLIPKKIWNEEEMYRKESRVRMQKLWSVEKVFYRLADSYTEQGEHAIQIVNTIYDSLKDSVDFYGSHTFDFPPVTYQINVNPSAIAMLFDSTLSDTTWDKHRRDVLTLFNQEVQGDTTNSGWVAYRALKMAYDSIQVDTNWTGLKRITVPFQYAVNIQPGYINNYDTTFVAKKRVQSSVLDSTFQVATPSEIDSTVYDTTWVPLRDLSDMQYRYPGLMVLDTSVTRETRWETKTEPVRPSKDWLYGPLTGKPYIIRVSSNGLHCTIKSPITGEYRESRYVFFTFSDTSHGAIEDGEANWKNQ